MWIHSTALLVILFTIASTVVAVTKHEKLLQLNKNARSNVIDMNDVSYPEFGVAKERDYSLFVFLTAASPMYKCAMCRSADPEFELLATSFKKMEKELDHDIFFVRVDYMDSPKTFQGYELTSVPVIFYIPPSTADSNEKPYEVSMKDRLYITSGSETSAEHMAAFVHDTVGVDISIHRSQLTLYVTIIAMFAAVLASIRPVITHLDLILSLIRIKGFWLIASLGVYTCSISGFIFDIIRSPPMFQVDRNGVPMYFYPHSGNQYVAEGFIIGFLNLACAAGLICICGYFNKWFDMANTVKNYALIGSLFVTIYTFLSVRSFYIMKNQWYGRSF